MFKRQVDLRSEPIQRVVALGESTTWGYSVSSKDRSWIIDEDHCHPNDLGHRLIANRVFEAIARNCSFVACRMPKETLIRAFSGQYGNGPDLPSASVGAPS